VVEIEGPALEIVLRIGRGEELVDFGEVLELEIVVEERGF